MLILTLSLVIRKSCLFQFLICKQKMIIKQRSVFCLNHLLPCLHLCMKICFSSFNSDCRVIVFLRKLFHGAFDPCQIPMVSVHISRVCLKEPMWMSYSHLKCVWFARARVVCAEESVNPFGVLVSFWSCLSAIRS